MTRADHEPGRRMYRPYPQDGRDREPCGRLRRRPPRVGAARLGLVEFDGWRPSLPSLAEVVREHERMQPAGAPCECRWCRHARKGGVSL
jgi:hypothetical protein